MISFMDKTKSCCIVVYGCAKNQVDGEEMAGRLKDAGFTLTKDPKEADLVIIHTCGFIEDAKKESIEGILSAVELAKEKSNRERQPKILVTGCLSQRYSKELSQEIPEVDGFCGTRAPRDIINLAEKILSGERLVETEKPGRGAPSPGKKRVLSSFLPWAYLKVSEGCRHHCTYCAIPSMRGPLSSRTREDILDEAKYLLGAGVKELNLIAEDLTDYGLDIYGRRALPDLLRRLSLEVGVPWTRLLYVRPDGVTPELAQAMKETSTVPYVDLPIEHGSERILKVMGRPGKEIIRRALGLLRDKLPSIAVRTTIITGFPGEKEEDLAETIDFLEEIRPHRVASFPYSPEEGTPAYSLSDQVPLDVRIRRAEKIRAVGIELAKSHSASLMGKTIPVLLIKPSRRKGWFMGRAYHQAPEVDGVCYVKTSGQKGDIVVAQVQDAGVLDAFCVNPEYERKV